MSEPAIALRDVVKRYPMPSGAPPLEVLRGVDLEVAACEAVAIVGPSGSGKSTLLHLVGALDRPDAGVIRVAGQDLGPLGEGARADLRNRRLGFVFQSHELLPQCSALENVLVPTLAQGKRGRAQAAADLARARELLDAVGLGARVAHRPGQLSIGERQRVAVARALVMEPDVVLADEPTGALDRQTGGELGELLLALREQRGTTLLVVTHDPELAARHDRVLTLRDGVLAPEGGAG